MNEDRDDAKKKLRKRKRWKGKTGEKLNRKGQKVQDDILRFKTLLKDG